MPPGEDMFKFHGYSGPCPSPPLPKNSPSLTDADGGTLRIVNPGERGRMVQIADFIKELQSIQGRWGNTCIYIRDLSWGSVALNRKADDDRRIAELKAREVSDRDDPDIHGN